RFSRDWSSDVCSSDLEVTPQAIRFVEEAGMETGLLTLFVRHTSCSLLIQENADPDVRRDLDAFFRRLVPAADDPAMDYIVHRDEIGRASCREIVERMG